MRLLLDTHTFLWFIEGNDKLSDLAHELIIDIDNQILLSVVSLWEIAVKVNIGKLTLALPFRDLMWEQLSLNEIEILFIKFNHLSELLDLPLHHRDPFDRLIIAQAMAEDLPTVTRDAAFQAYPIRVIW